MFGSLLVTAAALALAPDAAGAIERRLGEVTGTTIKRPFEDVGYDKKIVNALKRLGDVAPRSASEKGKLQQRLIAAGYRGHEALIVFFGLRLGVALAAFALFTLPIVIKPHFFIALVACLLGYVVPGMLLARLAKRRQHKMRLGLADVLDLLVVSVEAGGWPRHGTPTAW